MRLLIVGLLVLAVIIAGCMDGPDGVTPGDEIDGENSEDGNGQRKLDPEVRAGEAPASWAIGDYWVYETDSGAVIDMVVTDEFDDFWYVQTSNEELAWLDTRNNVSYLGEVTKKALAGVQGDQVVEFFNFPLEDGNEWNATWNGTQARIILAETGDSFEFEIYEVQNNHDGGEERNLVGAYTYDPVAGWFGEMTFYDDEEEKSFHMELTDYGMNYTGGLSNWLAVDHVRILEESGQGGSSQSFQTTGDHEELWIHLECAGNNIAHVLATPYLPPAMDEQFAFGPFCFDESETLVLSPAMEAAWHLDYRYLTYGYFIIEVWERTLEVREFGA